MPTNSLLPDPRDEAEIERLENLLCNLRDNVRTAVSQLNSGCGVYGVSHRLQMALDASTPSRKES